jgi:hypothetical protein
MNQNILQIIMMLFKYFQIIAFSIISWTKTQQGNPLEIEIRRFKIRSFRMK